MMTLGDQLFAYLGMEPPALYVANRERRVGVCLGAWLLGNAAHNALTATGAFEVFYDGRLVRAQAQPSGECLGAWLLSGLARTTRGPLAHLACGLVCALLMTCCAEERWWPLRHVPCGKRHQCSCVRALGPCELRAPPLLHVRT